MCAAEHARIVSDSHSADWVWFVVFCSGAGLFGYRNEWLRDLDHPTRIDLLKPCHAMPRLVYLGPAIGHANSDTLRLPIDAECVASPNGQDAQGRAMEAVLA